MHESSGRITSTSKIHVQLLQFILAFESLINELELSHYSSENKNRIHSSNIITRSMDTMMYVDLITQS